MEGYADQRCFISTRTELASRTTDWERRWRLARLKGLGPENTSFLFRLVHKLLVTKERQSRTNPASSPTCTALGCGSGCVKNLEHALTQCQANNGVGMALMQTLTVPTLTPAEALRLEINVSAEEELPLVWLLAATLLSIWEQRKTSQKVHPYLVRANLEAKVNLLRNTSYLNCSTILSEKIQFLFDNC